jgi:hypothetical protein
MLQYSSAHTAIYIEQHPYNTGHPYAKLLQELNLADTIVHILQHMLSTPVDSVAIGCPVLGSIVQ